MATFEETRSGNSCLALTGSVGMVLGSALTLGGMLLTGAEAPAPAGLPEMEVPAVASMPSLPGATAVEGPAVATEAPSAGAAPAGTSVAEARTAAGEGVGVGGQSPPWYRNFAPTGRTMASLARDGYVLRATLSSTTPSNRDYSYLWQKGADFMLCEAGERTCLRLVEPYRLGDETASAAAAKEASAAEASASAGGSGDGQ